ncbi:HTH-type transcriptional regulator ZntR [Ascidiaceihabitans donghaensis]|uniref:HTH-type transcriptional regulator ZntR n=1 Tax=Ascidiaceihabitans donghaensis TaxID=1510460 RepID=A0A2R8BGL1_9RHOB|nr:HTH-type transcriptional regulator ZntR [Ascidiaceihabitans donghaensis]
MSDLMPETIQDKTLTIREMCEAFGVTPRTLRFYEAKELLFPERIGQKRLFTRSDRARLKLILRGKRFGFSLEEIRQLLDLYHVGDQQQTQFARAYDVAKDRLSDMEAQRDELTEAIDDLKSQMKWGEKILASMSSPKKAAE